MREGQMEKNDGGPAFPFPTEATQRGYNGTREGEPGMSLRDYFAAAALQGMLANSFNDGFTKPMSLATAEEIADMAFRQADCMLAERSK